MKTLPIALATHVALDSTSTGYLLVLRRKDGTVYAFTSADTDVTIGSVTLNTVGGAIALTNVLHLASPGLSVSSLVLSEGLAVDNAEITTLDDGSVFTKIDVLSDAWVDADFLISRYNIVTPANGTEPLFAGTTGVVTLDNGKVTVELRGLQQYLQQSLVEVSSKTCRNRLGDARCKVVLAPFTFVAAVTTLNTAQSFTASALTQAADFFGEGLLTWTSGLNAGAQRVVIAHAAGGVLTLAVPMWRAIGLGDTFTVVAGCRKRLADCRDKFANVLNMRAEPQRPTVDALTQAAEE